MLLTALALALQGTAPAAGRAPAAAAPLPPTPPHVLAYTEDSDDVQTLLLDGGRSELEIGDVNADGHPDIVSVGDHGSPFVNTQEHGVMVWFGDGQGGFALVQTGTFGYGGVALGDVNGDGLVDVGYGVHHDYSSSDLGDQLLEVALGDGTGLAWLAWDDGLATDGETWGMFGTDFGDVDADGDLDVGSNSFGCCAGVHVYANAGDGTWSSTFGFVGGNSRMDFEFRDFDGDGDLDALAANDQGKVWLGQGDGTFTAADFNLPAAYGGVSGGDVDGDGRDEVALIVSGRPEVWSLAAGGDSWVSRSAGLPGASSLEMTQLVDMDADGVLDLLATGNGAAAVFAFDGATWSLLHEFATPGQGSKSNEAMRAGDLDHNGFPDVLIWQDEGSVFTSRNTFRVFRESSTPAAPAIHPVEPSPGRVWREGQVRFVDWTAAVPPGQVATVDLELSTVGPTGPWAPLAQGRPNGGRWQLVVPAGLGPTDAWIRYTLDLGPSVVRTTGPTFRIVP